MSVKDEIDRTIVSHPNRVRALTLSARYWLEFCREIGARPERSFVRYSGYAAGDPPPVLVMESWD